MGCDIIKTNEEIKSNKKSNNNENNFLEKINSKALDLHNKYRKKHNSQQLELSYELCKKAQKKVNDLINGNYDETIDSEEDNKLGENICISNCKDVDVEKACQSWYDEGKSYNFDLNTYQRGTTHFTQMVWKDTKEVGFGYSKLQNGKSYFIALYLPSGNELFKFKENVE